MSEPAAAPPRMTVAVFLKWDDGTDNVYELIDGLPVLRHARSGGRQAAVAMAPAADPHGRIAISAGVEIDRRLQARPACSAAGEAGVWVSDERYYVADVAATCSPPWEDGYVNEPFLIVEVVSNPDRGKQALGKVQDYIALPSVQEIWLIDSRKRWVQQWRRGGEDSWIVGLPLTGSAAFESPALGGEPVALDRLYRNTGL